MKGIGAIVIEKQYIYKSSLLKIQEWEHILYIGASLKEFVIRNRQNKYKIAKKSNSNNLNLRL